LEQQLQILQTELKKIHNLTKVAEFLGWDQLVNMPLGGSEARAEQIAMLEKFTHKMFIRDELGELLESVAQANFDYESDEAALIRLTRREYDRARKLSPELVEQMSRTFSLGQQIWTQAHANKDFAQFKDILQKIVDLNIQRAEAYGYQEVIYDALLDSYEPGMKTTTVTQVFNILKAELVPLVQAITPRLQTVNDAVFKQDYDESAQWDFSLAVLQAIGFDFTRGRQDRSAHPFTTSFSINDVRITNRLSKNSFPSSLLSGLHEGGHALYEQGIDLALEGMPLAEGTSLGVHESQSRLWENIVGRSREFWQFYFPRLKQIFPNQLAKTDMEGFYRAINRVEPSFIRTDADEVTYNLHIFLRFELEQDLLEQRLRVADLPEAWRAKMKDYLGITPPNDALGVLQDVHWSGGSIGYFPTYTLGNVLSVQFYQQALCEMPNLPEQFVRGEFGQLLAWLRYRIHRHGRKFTANELIQRVTGAEMMDAQPYLAYIKKKFGEIYGR